MKYRILEEWPLHLTFHELSMSTSFHFHPTDLKLLESIILYSTSPLYMFQFYMTWREADRSKNFFS